MAICLAAPVRVLQSGGVEVLVCELASGLAEHCNLLLATCDDSQDIEASRIGPRLAGHLKIDPKHPGCADALIDWLTKNHADLCHFHSCGTFSWNATSWNGCVITRVAARGIPCFNTNHQAVTPFDADKTSSPLWRRLASFAKKWPGKSRQLSNVKAEILVSKNDRAATARFFPLQRRRMRTIYHSRLDLGSLPSVAQNSRVILCLASICFRKGQHILAEAFARIADQHPDWSLNLVGRTLEPGCAQRIQQIAETAGITDRIQMPGPTTQAFEEIANAGIYVQPSLLEGLGLSLQEAMILGRPAIGSRTGGIPELITHRKSGILVEPGSPSDMASALDELISNPMLRQSMGDAASEDLKQKGMNRQAMCQAYIHLYGI